MSHTITLDTETTGLCFYNRPLTDPSQPHLVQLSALQAAGHDRIAQSMSLMVRPEGWTIPEEATAVHGITTETALDWGLPEKLVLDAFLELWSGGEPFPLLLIAHNAKFDKFVISCCIARHYGDCELLRSWLAAETYCTMEKSKPIVQARNVKGHLKQPKLTEAYEYFFNCELERAHSANADAVATLQIYHAIQSLAE